MRSIPTRRLVLVALVAVALLAVAGVLRWSSDGDSEPVAVPSAPTLEATPERTPTPTPEVTPEPTPTATPEPTPTATPEPVDRSWAPPGSLDGMTDEEVGLAHEMYEAGTAVMHAPLSW